MSREAASARKLKAPTQFERENPMAKPIESLSPEDGALLKTALTPFVEQIIAGNPALKGDPGEPGPQGIPGPQGVPGPSGGGRVWLMSAQPGLPAIPKTDDCTTAINNAMAALALEGGGELEMDGPVGGGYFVNGKLRQPSNVTLRWLGDEVPLIYGSMGSHEMSGELGEDPQSRNIRSAIAAGSRTIPLANSTNSNHTNYNVGERIILRGQNDAFGASLFKDSGIIESIDGLLNTLTLKEELDNDYLPIYPDSAWPNDSTTIRKQLQALLVIDPVVGGTTITVNNPSMFAVGTHVVLTDDMLGTDVAGVVSNNLVNMEANEVVAIDGPVLTLAYPIMHPYKTAKNAAVQVVLPVVNARVENATVRWAANSDKNSRYAFSILYGRDCTINGCKTLGDPVTGLGPRGHCFRIGMASLRCTVSECVVWRPTFFGSGQGYGATIYKGARFCNVVDNWFEGCRHSVLLFSGACQNFIARNHSKDCRGTDYDLHGAREAGNWFHQNKAIGGPSRTPSINQRAAFKVGNTTHTAGSFATLITENEIVDYDGHAFHVIPSSDDCIIARNTVRRITGAVLQLDRNSNAPGIKIRNIKLIDNTIDECGELFGTNGSAGANGNPLASDTYSGVKISGNRCTRMRGTVDLIEAYRVTGLVVNDNDISYATAPATGVLAIRLENCPAPELDGFRERGGVGGVRLVNSPGAQFTRFDVANPAGRPPLADSDRVLLDADAASVEGLSFTDYVVEGFDPSFVLGATGATIAARATAFALARDALSRPATIAGASTAITFGSSEPAATVGLELCRVTIKPRTPRSTIAFQGNIPSVVFSAADNAAALVFWSQDNGATWNFGGARTWRGTSGASSDTGVAISGAFQHALNDLATPLLVQLRVGPKTSTTDLTLADRFGASNRAVLTCREAA